VHLPDHVLDHRSRESVGVRRKRRAPCLLGAACGQQRTRQLSSAPFTPTAPAAITPTPATQQHCRPGPCTTHRNQCRCSRCGGRPLAQRRAQRRAP
jgi:hypothetical protein